MSEENDYPERMKRLDELVEKLRKKMEEQDHIWHREWLKDADQTTIKLPESLRQHPKRHLRDVAVGEPVFVSASTMRVDVDRNCFLDPAAEVQDRAITGIRVGRREDGYHITVRDAAVWQPREHKVDGWYPIASITETNDWWLGQRRKDE